MPTIPAGNERLGLIETSAPGANLAETGQQWGALIQAGKQISDVGFELEKKRRDAEDSSYAFNSKMEDLKEISEFEEELKKNTPADGADYYKKYNDFINTKYNQRMQNAPSERARRMYQESVQPMFTRAGIEAQGYENTTKAKYWKNSIFTKTDDLAKTYVDKPDYRSAPQMMTDLNTQVDSQVGTLYTPAEAEEIKKTLSAKVSNSLADGLALQERYSEGLKLLKSDDPSMSGLTPDQKADWTKRFMAQKKAKEEISKAEINRQIRDMSVKIMSPDGATGDQIDALIKSLPSAGLDKYEQQRAMHELSVAKIASSSVKQISRQNISDIQSNYDSAIKNIDEYTKKTGLGDYEAQVYKNKLTQAMTQVLNQREKDPVSFISQYIPEKRNLIEEVNSSNPEVSRAAAEQLVRYQDYLGIQNKQVLSDSQAFNYATMIATSGNSDSAASVISELQNRYGSNFSYIRNQILDTKKVDSGVFTSSYLYDSRAKATVIANERASANLKKFKSELNSSDKKNFNDYLSDKVSDIIKPLVEASADNKGLQFAQMFRDSIEKEALSQMTRGVSYDDAIDSAKDIIWDKNFLNIKARNNEFVIPKQLPNGELADAQAIQTYIVRKSNSPEIVKTFGITVPPEIKAQRPDLKDDEIRSRYLSDIQSRGRWVSNQYMTGARFMIPGSNGELIPVMDKIGMPIEVEYSEMQSPKTQIQLKKERYAVPSNLGGRPNG